MKIVNLLIVMCFVGLSACSGEEMNFYMTNNDEEIMNVNCTMKNVKIRTNVSTLINYQGGDIRVQFDMVNDASEVIGEGTGEVYIRAKDIPEDNMLWIDLNEKDTPVYNTVTKKPYRILHYCYENILDRPSMTTVQITYYEQTESGERKVGYVDTILIMNY
ncbi:MAG: hypothetical protein HWE22_13605 [Flavobacteriales bacterium]|nr:hypothetical protein [Flavobacteriales bacterium]